MMLQELVRTGKLAQLRCGQMLLVRFEKLLLFAHVLEVHLDSVVISFKGLELQGTDCHAVEASFVDELFQSAFDHDEPSVRQ